MEHRAANGFREAYLSFPQEIRSRADKQFALLETSPLHRSLQIQENRRASRKRDWVGSCQLELSRPCPSTTQWPSVVLDRRSRGLWQFKKFCRRRKIAESTRPAGSADLEQHSKGTHYFLNCPITCKSAKSQSRKCNSPPDYRRLSVAGSGWMVTRYTSGHSSLKRSSSEVIASCTRCMGKSSGSVQWQER